MQASHILLYKTYEATRLRTTNRIPKKIDKSNIVNNVIKRALQICELLYINTKNAKKILEHVRAIFTGAIRVAIKLHRSSLGDR